MSWAVVRTELRKRITILPRQEWTGESDKVRGTLTRDTVPGSICSVGIFSLFYRPDTMSMMGMGMSRSSVRSGGGFGNG